MKISTGSFSCSAFNWPCLGTIPRVEWPSAGSSQRIADEAGPLPIFSLSRTSLISYSAGEVHVTPQIYWAYNFAPKVPWDVWPRSICCEFNSIICVGDFYPGCNKILRKLGVFVILFCQVLTSFMRLETRLVRWCKRVPQLILLWFRGRLNCQPAASGRDSG